MRTETLDTGDYVHSNFTYRGAAIAETSFRRDGRFKFGTSQDYNTRTKSTQLDKSETSDRLIFIGWILRTFSDRGITVEAKLSYSVGRQGRNSSVSSDAGASMYYVQYMNTVDTARS